MTSAQLFPSGSGRVMSVAGAILGRDPGSRAHRLTATILGCAVWWSGLEVIWNGLDDPALVPWLVRLSSIGWMPLGALCLHLCIELIGDARLPLRRFLPILYLAAGVSIFLYVTTPLGVEGAVHTSWPCTLVPRGSTQSAWLRWRSARVNSPSPRATSPSPNSPS